MNILDFIETLLYPFPTQIIEIYLDINTQALVLQR